MKIFNFCIKNFWCGGRAKRSCLPLSHQFR